MIKKKYIPLILLIIINILLRFSIVSSFYETKTNLEECAKGTIAKEIIESPSISLFYYPLLHEFIGQLTIIYSVVPFYLLFGINGYALKASVIFESCIIIVFVYYLMSKFFNLRVGLITASLFVFSPTLYTFYSLIVHGVNLEAMFFSLIIMYTFFLALKNKREMYYCLFGLASGYSIWNIGNTIMVFTTILFWFCLDKLFFLKKRFFIYLISFLLGSANFIYFNAVHDFEIIKMFQSTGIFDIKSNIGEFIFKLSKLLIHDIPDSFFFQNIFIIKSTIINYAYYFIFIIALIYAIYHFILRKKDLKVIFFIVYLTVYSLFYCLSGFPINYENHWTRASHVFLIVIYPFIFFLIALLLDNILKKNRKLFIIMMLFIIIVGLANNISLIDFDNFGKVDHSAYCYKYTGFFFAYNYYLFYSEKERNINICSGLKNNTAECYQGFGMFIGLTEYYENKSADSEQIYGDCKYVIDKVFREECKKGATFGLGNTFGDYPGDYLENDKINDMIRERIKQCGSLEEYTKECYDGIKFFITDRVFTYYQGYY